MNWLSGNTLTNTQACAYSDSPNEMSMFSITCMFLSIFGVHCLFCMFTLFYSSYQRIHFIHNFREINIHFNCLLPLKVLIKSIYYVSGGALAEIKRQFVGVNSPLLPYGPDSCQPWHQAPLHTDPLLPAMQNFSLLCQLFVPELL